MSRIKAREAAFSLLYAWQFNRCDADLSMEVMRESVEIANIDDDDICYIRSLLNGYALHHEYIDTLVEDLSVDWKIERISKVDLSILRLGIQELLYDDAIPNAVIIDQCVELAKRYSTEKSSAFIHGILSGAILHHTQAVAP